MIIKGSLSLSQQEAGRRNFDRFNFTNGLSYICLGETIIILFAIKLGSPDYCIAILGSLFFMSNFCMPLGKLLMARMGAIKATSLCWLLRNVAILLVAAAPFIGWLFAPQAATFAIIAGAFAFYACRSIGVTGMQPVMGEITTVENRGKFTSRTHGFFYLANFIMLSLIMLLMSQSKEVWVYVATISTGALLGFASTWFLSRIDETEAIRASARKPVMEDVLLTLKNPMRLRQLAANCVISSAITLVVPISMLALKKGYGISDTEALFFALAQLGGAVATSYVIGLLSEETGPRPLAILFYCSLIALCILWVIGPDHFKWHYMIWPFVLAGSAVIGTSVAMTHYFLISIPNKERVAASLTIYVISGVVAGLAGSLVGGGMLKYLDTFGLPPIEMFKIYFLAMICLLLLGLLAVSRLKPLADWNVSEVLGLAFAPKDIMTLFTLYSIKQVANPKEEGEDMQRLLEIRSGLSEKALLSYLDSPKFSFRSKALSALGEIPFGERTAKALLDELEDGEHTTAHIAAQIAGERGIKEALPLLRKYLRESEDFYLKGKTMLSLAQLKDAESFAQIKSLFKETENPRLMMFGASALAEIGDDEAFSLLLEKTASPGVPEKVLYEMIYSMAQLAGQGDRVYKFLKLYSKDRPSALMYLAELCQDGEPSDRRVIFDFDGGTIPKHGMVKALAKEFAKSDAPKANLIAAFLKSPHAEDAPAELLLCLMPLKGGAKPEEPGE